MAINYRGIKLVLNGESETYYWDLYSNSQTSDLKNLRMEKCAFSDGSSWYYTAWYYGG